MTKGLSASEKVDLIEEYIKTTGKEITGKTEYKGYPIGVKLIELRSMYANEKIKLTPDVIDRLNRLGLLERKTEKISDRINELEKYCTKNRQLWLWVGKYTRFPERKKDFFMKVLKENNISPIFVCKNTSKTIRNKKDRAYAEFLKMAENYEYIRNRASNGGVSEKDLNRLRNAGVGRIFGESKETIELSKKTGLSIEEINVIIKNFGSVEEFRRVYIDLMKNSILWTNAQMLQTGTFEKNRFLSSFFKSEKQYESFMKLYKYFIKREKLVTCFDLSKPNFLPSGQTRNIVMAMDEDFITVQFINEDLLMQYVKEALKPNEMVVLQSVIGQGRKTKTEIAKEELNVSTQRVSQLYQNALAKIGKEGAAAPFYEDVDSMRKICFIDKYFEYKDIFITLDSFEVSEEMRDALLGADSDIKQEYSKQNETDVTLKKAIKDLDEVYKELEKEEERYLSLKSKIVKILHEKSMTANETTKEVIMSYLWQLESAESQLNKIAERKRKVLEDKNDR